jgi:DNA-binding transcriptional ArsR family regulator
VPRPAVVAAARAAGRCVSCITEDVELERRLRGLVTCGGCAEYKRIHRHNARRDRRQRGLCFCGAQPRRPGGSTCEACHQASLARERAARAAARRCCLCEGALPPPPPELAGPRHSRHPARVTCPGCLAGRLPGDADGPPLARALVLLVDGPRTLRDLADELGQHERNVRRHLDLLVARGLVEAYLVQEVDEEQGNVKMLATFRLSRAAGCVG